MHEFGRFPLQRLLGLDEFAFGALSRTENASGVLKRNRAQQLLFAIFCCHQRSSISDASAVPRTRARILANAVSRLVDVSSLKGENPQSSVVPSCSTGMYSAASRIRSRTSSGVSMRGSMVATTPIQIR